MLVFTVRVPGETPRRVRADRPVMTLGRASTNDVPLADRTLSRVHAKIEMTERGIQLVDLGSRNGTMLNGARVEAPVTLKSGDRIRLGETSIDASEESTTRVLIDGPDRQSSDRNTLFRSSMDLLKPRQEAGDPRMGADELARLNASLRILNEVSIELLGHMTMERLFTLIVDKVFSYLEPDRGLLMLADPTGELRLEVVKFAEGVDPSDIRLSKTLVQSVMERRNGVLMIDTKTDLSFGAADSLRIQGVTSCMAAPLLADAAVIGLVYLEVRLGRKSFTEEDLRLLTLLANTAAIKIQNLKLLEESVEKQRIEREMALAWEIQRRLLPDRDPELPNTRLQGRTIPSRTVSGDYYDFFERSDRTVDIVVADVCGKGMGASILAASVQAAYQAWASENFPPDKLCARLNDLVHRRTSSEKFVTLFLAHYDPETGGIIYTNAGHNSGILIRADGRSELLPSNGIPLGLFPGRPYGAGSLTMQSGDLLVLYTDGITEAVDSEDHEFGLARLIEVSIASRAKPLSEIEIDIGVAVSNFANGIPYGDDRTLVLLKRVGSTGMGSTV